MIKNPRVAFTVSIPVTLGGYTGQRDEWEEGTHDYAVTVRDDKVVLSGGGSTGRQIIFDRAGLTAALDVLARYDADAKPKPVMRARVGESLSHDGGLRP